MIGIINYGLGNIRAFSNIYKLLDIPFIVVSNTDDMAKVTKIILPGVGAFDQAVKRLQNSGLRECLDENVICRKKPVLGVCVGMQMLARTSEEGVEEGLGWIDGATKKFDQSLDHGPGCVPHMGWNDVRPVKENGLFYGLEQNSRFYFLHSYYFSCNRSEDALAVTTYGAKFVSAINCGNVYGVQFHPEKSHSYGIRLLKNFWEL